MGISINLIKKAILEFKGVQRRFNFIFEYNKKVFIMMIMHIIQQKLTNYLNLREKFINQKK